MQASTTPTPSCADLLHDAEGTLWAAGVSTPRLDAEVLLATALETDRSALYCRLHQAVPAHARSAFALMLERRRRREPVAYITGVREFWSLPIRVTPAVLVPRPESELLVESVIGLFERSRQRTLSVWDAGTGSGCLAVALARELPRARIVATDVWPAALQVALGNAVAHDVAGRILFACADLADGLRPEQRFDVVVSNPPYLTEGEPLSPELAWEPASALAAGADGLEVIRRLLRQAAARLREGGFLAMEMGFGQEAAVRRLAAAVGLVDLSVRADYAGIPRVLIGRAARSADG
jgi:release factor glutamine methyltransferase